MPTVSIALATYNGGHYLAEQLESFAAQTRLPDELVVCDDGSVDETPAILESFRSRAPFPVRIHLSEVNEGYNRNFEKALSLCAGDIIFLSDQDDVWFPEKIARMLAVFAVHPHAQLVIGDQLICDAELNTENVTVLGNTAALGFGEDSHVPGCATALRQEWRDISLPIPEEGIAYDSFINGLGDSLGVRVVLRETLQLYRRHGGNASDDLTATVSAARKVRASLRSDAAALQTILRATIADSGHYIERMESRRERLDEMGLGLAVDEAIMMLRARSDAASKRARALATSRTRRPFAVGRLLVLGGYRSFQGWKSAARDLTR